MMIKASSKEMMREKEKLSDSVKFIKLLDTKRKISILFNH